MVRTCIAECPEQWSRVINGTVLSNYFGKLQEESLKRTSVGFGPDTPHVEDIKRKSCMAFRHVKPQTDLTSTFISKVEVVFTLAIPLMQFITSALEIRN